MAQAPINLRLSPERLHELEIRARTKNMPLRTLAQRYLEEGMRIEAHPLIRFVDDAYGRSAILVGTDYAVWQIVRQARADDHRTVPVDEIAGLTGLETAQVTAALDYSRAFGEEIDAQLELVALNTRVTE